MAGVVLKDVCKIYPSRDKRHPEGVMAVKNFNIDISDNEFVVFVGPSGCGKSTTLRMIAGLEDISSGELYIDGQYMNNTEPKNRDISMVFQNYALYPHMTAYENIAFGLTLRKVTEPVYEENDTTAASLSEIAAINEDSKSIKKKKNSADKRIISIGEAVAKLTARLQIIEYKIEQLSAHKVKSAAMQIKLDKFNAKQAKLSKAISAANAEMERLTAESAECSQTLEENDGKITQIRKNIASFQKTAIDLRTVSELEKNIAYYNKLAETDAERRARDEADIEKNETELKSLKAAIANTDGTAQKELYKLKFRQEQLIEENEFCRNELDILDLRKKTIEKFLKESEEKLEFYKTNEQPVFKYRKYTKIEIDRKVKMASEILGIEALLQRKPREMSGGQRQRIALGRAIVREPKVFLLDEPLSNLDAKLRATMRVEISRIHEKLKTTFIYVTHDQVEAMTMGTRIVVMKDGIIQQIDTPTNLFDYPDNVFVAGFIGTPQMNFFNVKVKTTAEQIYVTFKDGYTAKYSKSKMRKLKPEYDDGNEHDCVLGIRGEHVKIAKDGVTATVNEMEILGNETHLHLTSDSAKKDVIIKLTERTVATEAQVKIVFEESKIHLFDAGTELTVLERD